MTIITTVIWGDRISSHAHMPEAATDAAETVYGKMLLAAIDGTIDVIGNENSSLRSAVGQLIEAFSKAHESQQCKSNNDIS